MQNNSRHLSSRGCVCCRHEGPIGGSRRRFVAAVASAGLGTLAGSALGRLTSMFEPALLAKGSLIDVHHHFVPPFYFSDNRERIAAAGGGRVHPAYGSWTSEQTLAAMDKEGVAVAVLSLTVPGVWFGDAQAAALTARRVNEYGADLVGRHRGRFGLFAVIPLPHAESSLREIDYAFSALKADGIGLMTSYDDKWLGDPMYEPVFQELNWRKAVVFVHPTTGLCCRMLTPDINPFMLEIPQDTSRAVANLLFSGTLAKFRGIRFIFTHAGGTVPMVVNRMRQYAAADSPTKTSEEIERELKRLYYDIAGTAYPPAIAALTRLVPTTQILFGSDNPFVPLADTAEGVMTLGFSERDLRQITHDNALRLMPGLNRT